MLTDWQVRDLFNEIPKLRHGDYLADALGQQCLTPEQMKRTMDGYDALLDSETKALKELFQHGSEKNFGSP